jgi:Zn-dependent peptidase ImmA (M78 family)
MDRQWASASKDWTKALRALQKQAEESGILVVVSGIVGNNTHRKLDVEEFRGFVLVDAYAPLVFINGADGKAAQMFTLAHELAHLWLGRSTAFDLHNLQPANDKVEQACNRIAAEFLVPADELREFWKQASQKPNRFEAIAWHFKVSEIVAARRALDLGFITQDDFLEFYKKYRSQERVPGRSQEGGDFYATQKLRLGRPFAEAIVRAVREGRLLYDEAYQLTGLYGKTFDSFARQLWGDGE